MERFYDKLPEELLEGPNYYFGRGSIFLFHAFLDGWFAYRKHVISIEECPEHRFLKEFEKWAQEKQRFNFAISWSKNYFIFAANEYDALKNCLNEMIEFRDHHFNKDG